MRGTWLALAAVLLVGCGEGDAPRDPIVQAERHEFRATAHGFEARRGNEAFRPFYTAGINFGLAVPGTLPGEFLATREQIARWIAATAELGLNTIRVYTVQSPEFYEELRRWNLAHPEEPLFLLQGAWLKEPDVSPADYLSADERLWFRDELEKVVDVVHGNRTILPGGPDRPLNWGRANGTYAADVSPWLLGWLIGREVEPYTLESTYELHPNERSYDGVYFRVVDGDPIEAYIAESFDYLVVLEETRYGERHPVAFSNWPTLDPMSHPTEREDSSDDWFAIDVRRIEADPSFTEGIFVSYHVYPYYPEFIVYQPDYQVSDAEGPNSFLGYLRDLRAHYAGYTLVISEIGLPSSQGSAKHIPTGLDHGGLDEKAQGHALVRSLGSIVDAGMDGFCVFSIIDEWFKRTWIVDPIELPADRRHLWHNVMSPEQNFGLIALRAGAPERFHFVDGEGDEWLAEPRLRKDGPAEAPVGDDFDSMRTLRELTIEHDEGYLHLLLRVEDLDPAGTGAMDWSKVSYWLAFDTLDPERGDGFLDPDGAIGVDRRVEFLLRIDGSGATMWVDRPYDLYAVWHRFRDESQAYRTVANDDGVFHKMRNLVALEMIYEGEELGPRVDDLIGDLPVGHEAEHSGTNFWYSLEAGTLEIRVPWSLLHVSDPSSAMVVDDWGESGRTLGTSQTPGIAVAAMSLLPSETPRLVDAFAARPVGDGWRIPSEGFATYSWDGWNTVRFHEYRKASFGILQEGLPALLSRAHPRQGENSP